MKRDSDGVKGEGEGGKGSEKAVRQRFCHGAHEAASTEGLLQIKTTLNGGERRRGRVRPGNKQRAKNSFHLRRNAPHRRQGSTSRQKNHRTNKVLEIRKCWDYKVAPLIGTNWSSNILCES